MATSTPSLRMSPSARKGVAEASRYGALVSGGLRPKTYRLLLGIDAYETQLTSGRESQEEQLFEGGVRDRRALGDV